MKHHIIRVLFMLSMGMLTVTSLQAKNMWCSGKVTGAYLTSTGVLVFKGEWRQDWTNACSVKGDSGIDTVTCSLWSSYLASAVQNNLQVTMMYSVSDDVTCANMSTYGAAPVPSYIMLKPAV